MLLSQYSSHFCLYRNRSKCPRNYSSMAITIDEPLDTPYLSEMEIIAFLGRSVTTGLVESNTVGKFGVVVVARAMVTRTKTNPYLDTESKE